MSRILLEEEERKFIIGTSIGFNKEDWQSLWGLIG